MKHRTKWHRAAKQMCKCICSKRLLLFHLCVLCLRLRNCDFDLWESERLVLLERNWCFDQVDALLQLFCGFCLLFLLLPLHPVVIPPSNKSKWKRWRSGFHESRKVRAHRSVWQKGTVALEWKRGRTNLISWCFASLRTLTLSIFFMALSVFSARFLSYLSGLFLFLSNSKVESFRKIAIRELLMKFLVGTRWTNSTRGIKNMLVISPTCVISFPCSRLYAFVHLTLRGFLFILKFLWHFDLQNLKICKRIGWQNARISN